MSISKTLKLFRSLNAEQKRMVKIKHVSAKHTTDEWLELLKKPALMDRFRDNLGGAMGWRIFFALVLAIGLPTLAYFQVESYYYDNYVDWDSWDYSESWTDYPTLLGIFLAALIVGVGLFVWAILLNRKIKNIDLGNHLRLFVVPMLAALKTEMKKKGTIEMDINVSAALNKENLKKVNNPTNKNYPKITELLYEVPWLYGKTKLLDDTVLEWNITDHVRHRKVVKRNPRGKIKHKEKFKVKHVVTVKTSFSKENYQLNRQPTEDMKFKDTGSSFVFTLKGGAISSDIYNSIPINRFLDLIAKNYSRVEPIA